MPTDVFWTGLFTVSGGLAGTFAGYASARSQTQLQDKQLKLEKERHKSERAQLDEDRAARRREQRREIYLRYLLTLDAIFNSATEDSLTQETLSSRWKSFMQADNELELAADERTRESSYPLQALMADITGRFSQILDEPAGTWPDDGSSYMHSVHDKLRELRQTLVGHMRSDLSSDQIE